jgi:hypothetical protein
VATARETYEKQAKRMDALAATSPSRDMPQGLPEAGGRLTRARVTAGRAGEQLHAFSPAQLRARALRLLEMADEFPDHDMEEVLLKLAAEFGARASALGRKH